MNRKRKGAFQMSLGMIVALVFAVILLTFSILWIQGMFLQFEDITHQATQLAKDQMINQLNQGEKIALAAPPVTNWKRGETGSYTLGIRNRYYDTTTRYSIYVFLEVCGGELLSIVPDDCGVGGVPSTAFKNVAQRILNYPKVIGIGPSDIETPSITIKPSTDVSTSLIPNGIYTFKVQVCDRSASTSDPAGCGSEECKEDYNLDCFYDSEWFALEFV